MLDGSEASEGGGLLKDCELAEWRDYWGFLCLCFRKFEESDSRDFEDLER